MAQQTPYVLGTGEDELQRLSLQHRLWSDALVAACKRAGLRIGHRVLDVGCGPGFAAFDFAQLVTDRGAVVAVDESQPFLDYLAEQARVRNLPQLRAVVGDVQRLDEAVTQSGFDLAYARWVLCFVPDPEAVVRGIAQKLRAGGKLVVHDYFNYTSMTLAPRSVYHDRAVAATAESWRARGGDPDIVGRLPAMLAAHGFEIDSIEVHQRIARGTDTMFGWLDTWWHTFVPKLVAMGRLAQADADGLLHELAAMRGDGLRFAQCPTVYEIVATKR
jgi:ubiquinone/menaquinone biosynthesis C-methylase UbiE